MARPPVPAVAPSVATAEPAASIVASSSAPPLATKPFNPIAARAALDALAPTLIDCQIASGRSGHIRVAFAPDGSVSSAKTLAPYADSPRGECVATHLSKARVQPFTGEAPAYIYGFVIPR